MVIAAGRNGSDGCRHQLVGRVLIVSLLVLSDSSWAGADETADAVAAIRKIGGTVRPVGKEWAVDFHLRGRRLTNKELVHVAALKNVVWLNVSRTKITSNGLVHLKGLDKLRWLHLEMTKVGDKGIEHVAGLDNLEYLNLFGTKITDKALEKLTRCKKLKRLYLWQTDVTDDGMARLQQALAKTRIVRGVDLSKLASSFSSEVEKPKKRVALKWVDVTSRGEAPAKSETGINCEILFENRSKRPVKLFWIGYGNGALKFYARLAPGATRKQNSYSKNAWLITDDDDQPLGFFLVTEDDSHAVVPGASP